MDIPEHLRHLVDALGEALVSALVSDPQSRELALELQREGYELTLSLEATPTTRPDGPSAPSQGWSEEDKALLKTFRIALE